MNSNCFNLIIILIKIVIIKMHYIFFYQFSIEFNLIIYIKNIIIFLLYL